MYNLILLLCFVSIPIVVGLAVDWISDKLYWIGYNYYGLYGYQSTGLVINITVLDLATNIQKTVINEHVDLISSYNYYVYRPHVIEDISNRLLHIVVDPFTRSVY